MGVGGRGPPSSPEVNVARPDGTDDDAKKEERETFLARPISASLLQGAWQEGVYSPLCQLFDKCMDEEEWEAQKEGTLLVPLPTQSSGTALSGLLSTLRVGRNSSPSC